MLPEPTVTCPNDHISCTLKQGAAPGMRCRMCGETLERADLRCIEYGFFFMMPHTKSDLAAVHNMICYWPIFWGRIQTKHKIPIILVLDQNGSFS